MKKIFTYMFSLLLLASCAADKGNYTYRELDDLEIGGIPDELSVLIQETLQLTPSLGDNAKDLENYTFEWKTISSGEGRELTVIGDRKDLDYLVKLSPGIYHLYFTVTDINTGIFWRKESELKVSSKVSEGWMVLCDDAGYARLDMYSKPMDEVYTDVLEGNGMPPLQGPRRIQWLTDKTDAQSPYYLMTDDGATRLGKDAFEWKPQYDFKYEVASPDVVIPWSITSAGFGKVVVSGTKAYYCEVMGIDGLYGSAVNKDFDLAPSIGANVSARNIYAALYLMYDITNKRFLTYCPMLSYDDFGKLDPVVEMDKMEEIAQTMHPEAGVVGNAFEWPSGLDYVYMENTRYDSGNGKMGTTYTILADGARRYVYGVQIGDLLPLKFDCTYIIGKPYFGDISSCEGVTSENALFAFSSLKQFLYYAIGDKVYRADLSADVITSELQFSLPGETITCMKFNLYRKDENLQETHDLVVASEKGGKGILRVYEGYDSDGDFSSVQPVVHEGFGRIVDVEYKERIN